MRREKWTGVALAALLFGWLMCGGAGINIAIHWALAG